jgi:hypothetical protein
MKTWHFYDSATGLFTGRNVSYSADIPGIDEFVASKVPAGQVAIVASALDWESSRVDLLTGEVVAYQPPAPDDDHEWNAQRLRWVLKPAALDRLRAEAEAASTVQEEEAGAVRAMRELLLSPDVRALLTRPEDLANLDRLQAADDSIAGARPVLAVPVGR